MAEICLPFKERFRKPLLNGIKTCTSRTRKWGQAGDIFEAFGQKFLIEDIQCHPLSQVRDDLWQAEGCESEMDFEQAWNQIHPRRKFQPSQWVIVHFFKKLS